MLNFSRKITVFILIVLIHFYFYGSDYVKKFDYKIYDLTTILVAKFQETENSTYSVIIDIDEKSIQEFGQWPWSRIIDAELINKTSKMLPSAIGVNILFPEKDRLSPLSIQHFYQKYFDVYIDLNALSLKFQDNDKLLSQVIRHSNVTLPIYLQNQFSSASHCQKMSYKENIFSNIKTDLNSEELLCNHASIQDEVESFGFINAWSDSDGIFRRVPLFMKHKEEVFPSFALATLLSFYDDIEIDNNEDTVLINFSMKQPKVLSASDVLNYKVLEGDIKGKVVILGSSVVGLNLNHRTLSGDYISNSMIHAMLVDNILSDTLIIQPNMYKKINVLLSFLFIFIFFIFLSKKRYLDIVLYVAGLLVMSSLLLVFLYMAGIYISIGYLWVPLISLLMLLIVYHLRIINKEQQEQEIFLIRQSKMASMGEMISLIAHQWRQPLSAINGTVLNMDIDYRQNKLGAEKFDNYLSEIENTTVHLSKTISDFTEFFSKNKQTEVFNLFKIIDKARQLSAISLCHNVELIYKNHEEIMINGHASELIQSLLVLLNNAIHVCQEKLETEKSGKVIVDVSTLGKNVLISVEDNGGGVERENIKKIFNPYFTTKDKHNGTGLGLYILKLIVEDSMNGKVFVHNGKEGAVFTIEIPSNMK